MTTTVALDKDVWLRLRGRAKYGQTLSQVVEKLLDDTEPKEDETT